MKIIISPAKIMKDEAIGVEYKSTPIFLDNALEIWHELQSKDDKALKKIWDCNDEIIKVNKARLQLNNLKDNLLPALMVFDGLQFKKMAANVFDEAMWDYVNNHLYILDALYGLLRPLDGINQYRLMMFSPLKINDHKDLYSYWGDKVYQEIISHDHDILNLASKEFSDMVTPYLKDDDHLVTVNFLSKNKKGELIAKSTEAKTCRGAMVRYCASNKINRIEDIKSFSDYNYHFDESHSTDDVYVFVKD